MSNPPSIPPRPARAQNSSAPAPSSSLTPQIPPRPKGRIERSQSPHRFDRSPLNDPTYAHGGPPQDNRRLSGEVPARPPSVSLPSIGQEGNEYASFEDLSKTLSHESRGSVQQSSIATDLPLHAPTASVPGSTAKRNIQAVTRTDSNQAAAADFGKLAPEDSVSSGTKTGRSGSSIGSRPASLYNDKEHQGIPEIGVQVPMFRNAGDVQAPTPNPYEQQGASTGVGFHNKPSGRHHGRTKSGREIFHGPPGSYGMHGHGKISNDAFEKKWYEKHPDDLKREKAGEYGPHIQENRKDYHWRADDLNKVIHGPTDIGFGTSREGVSTPDEQIGYRATEEYAMRMASPRPSSSASRPTSKAANQESALRHETSAEELDDNGDVIHIDPPAHRTGKVHGGGYDPPTEDLGPEGGNTDEKGGWVTERGYGTPILASDEVQKHSNAEWRQPAVSPELERGHDGEYTVNEDGTPAYLTKVRTHSRSSSRNNNRQQHRTIASPANFADRSGTPLESHKEYEPLFPEDEEDGKKPKTLADKVKRPNLARHHFPSQDVWEDAPGSLQLETTVDTPQAPEEPDTPAGGDVSAAKVFEPPEQEEKRKDTITKEDQQSFLSEHTRQFAAENKHLRGVRPTPQRFPSQDVWEDAPEHGHLETTVSGPQTPATDEYAPESPIVEKSAPTILARPSVPARPQRAQQESSPVDKKAPIIPDRPKPQVPTRPSKPSQPSSENVPTTDRAVENDAPQPKAKPPVPARPAGSKIAALQAGFLQDLNSKLGLGPQAPKVKEPEEEKEAEPAQPLSDARKGRAKGPQRRKPAASPAPAATVTAEVAVPRAKLELAPVTAIWSFGEDGALDVPAAKAAAQIQHALGSHKPAATEPAVEKEAEVLGGRADISEITDAPKISKAPIAETLENVAAPVVEAAKSVTPAAASSPSDAPVKEEPKSVKTAPGSFEAPGAFPELDAKGEAELEIKTSQPQESEALPLTKTESLSSTKAADVPSTQSQGATEEAPTALRESVADA
ncbi:uncharacterized protein M421DRAFT_98031 [Didymella exigua CBS 183.55]|uniref:Altered inheritance of mitochondria protein 21 n=1 Tax=Didymella exigua CBS 183.55 TaxID=1150837 RepID=A0A6A5S5P8_9PLEO|nr:uncharacterized protein M421DRAFT_98031 [Didymella exigua CBS 183.55]KAF1932817.1 hypothetical protein M421DRAFT_98031 [Didymella exigua CBS 183.55]